MALGNRFPISDGSQQAQPLEQRYWDLEGFRSRNNSLLTPPTPGKFPVRSTHKKGVS